MRIWDMDPLPAKLERIFEVPVGPEEGFTFGIDFQFDKNRLRFRSYGLR